MTAISMTHTIHINRFEEGKKQFEIQTRDAFFSFLIIKLKLSFAKMSEKISFAMKIKLKFKCIAYLFGSQHFDNYINMT